MDAPWLGVTASCMLVNLSSIAGITVLSSPTNDGPSNRKKYCSRLAHSAVSLPWYFIVCVVVFFCTSLWYSNSSFSFFNTRRNQWPHKQHHYHCVFSLPSCPTSKTKYCTIILSCIRRNTWDDYQFKAIIVSNNTDRLGAAWLSGTDQRCVQCTFHSLQHGDIWLHSRSRTLVIPIGAVVVPPFQYIYIYIYILLKNFLATD